MGAAKSAWTDEKRAQVSATVAAANTRRGAGMTLSRYQIKAGAVPWNKGNRWTEGLSPEQIRAVRAEWARRHRDKNERRKISDRVSAMVRFTLKRVGAVKSRVSWKTLLGYGVEELILHLEQTVPPGYTWQDYVVGRLELDHKIPVSAHNFASATDPDFQRCWALSNLQLLPARVNLDKRAKLSAPFQPSLSFH